MNMRITFLSFTLALITACNNSSEPTTGAASTTEEKKEEKKEASGCQAYYWFREGVTAEYSVSDGTGAEKYRSTSTIDNVRTENGALTADWVTDVSGKKVKATYKCEGDKIYMDMKSFFGDNFGAMASQGGMELDIEQAYVVFPSNMKPGDQLEGTKFKITAKKDGKPMMTTTNEVTDRKVESSESVTTAGGTWICMKITEKNTVTSEMMGRQMPGRTTTATYWFAPRFGLVKHEMYDDKGSLTLKTELVSIK